MKWRTMLFMMALASLAVPAASAFAPWQDGLTLDPVPVEQSQAVPPTTAAAAEELALRAGAAVAEPPLSLDTNAMPPQARDDRGGFIYEPIFTSGDGDRVEYQLGSGLGLGMTTTTGWTISQSVRLKKGMDLSVYYARPLSNGPREAGRGTGLEPDAVAPATSAGIHLEWKF